MDTRRAHTSLALAHDDTTPVAVHERDESIILALRDGRELRLPASENGAEIRSKVVELIQGAIDRRKQLKAEGATGVDRDEVKRVMGASKTKREA